ncbi:hypothetical protein [Streptomyces sp. KAU_LT]|uniref:hypothetical protein n=1 Tax=Streptomyces sp. KAU_LT TaxID=3046669 RepID=UPI0024B718D9|nr:hypothetical protein [Streptomyces sp. KAU_LT]MDI9836250.1 hypothetical protein [Streptomyces sp. KAU_LT]
MTAGPDERALHLVQGNGPESEQDAEDRIREELRRRGVGPGGPASSPPPMPPHPPAIPPQPAAEDADPQPGEQPQQAAPIRAVNDRLTPWWEKDKSELSAQEPAPAPAADVDEPDAQDEEQQEPAERGPRRSRRRVSKRPAKDDPKAADDAEEQDEESEEEGPRWSRPAMGRPPGLPARRHNLFTWWRGMEPHTKWLLYHGTGLGAGLYFGVPAWGYEGHRFIVNPRAGEFEVWSTWGLLALLLMADYRVRNLFPPLAWAVRGVSTSVLVGAAWYGTPLADITL